MRIALRCLALACVFGLCLPALAEDDAQARARKAYENYQQVWKNCEAARKKAFADSDEGQSEQEKKAERERLKKLFKQIAEAEGRARNEFLDAFEKTDWEGWDLKKDDELVEVGLFELGLRDRDSDVAKSIKAWEALLAKLPQCPSAFVVRPIFLPLALASSGDIEHAIKRTSELLRDAPEDEKPGLLLMLGDMRALGGEIEGAQAEYLRALKLIPADASEYDNVGQTRADLELRVRLLGKAAPEIDSKNWLGAEAKKLSQFAGSVVIVNFWASYSDAALRTLPDLDDFFASHMHEGLQVLGVTRIYDRGYVPRDMSDLRTGIRDGEVLQDMDEAACKKHLADLRENTKVRFPFVLAQAADFESYGVSTLPTTIVLDRQGKVAFVASGGMRGPLVRIAAQRLLKTK